MKTIQIRDSISEEWHDVPASTQIRFDVSGRHDMDVTDTWIEVCFDRYIDGVQIRALGQMTISPEAGNAVVISPDKIQGGETEIVRLRNREAELVVQLNEARDTFGTRKRVR